MIVPAEEAADYAKKYPYVDVLAAPEFVTNYSEKFQYLLDEPDLDKTLIMDDDLVFSRKSEFGKLITIRKPSDLHEMFAYIEELLDSYNLVGVHPRQMGNYAKTPFVLNGRIICMQGVNLARLDLIKVDQFPILSDVVLNCTLLSRGQPNAIITTFFQDHGPCQAPGGCSTYRTPAMQRAAVNYLADRFSGYVSIVERTPKVAKWMGDTRIDYRCQWKELYKAGEMWRNNRGPSPDKENVSGRV